MMSTSAGEHIPTAEADSVDNTQAVPAEGAPRRRLRLSSELVAAVALPALTLVIGAFFALWPFWLLRCL